MMVPAEPTPALKVIEPECVFECGGVLFDLPAAPASMDGRAKGWGRRVRRIPQHPVVAGLGCVLRPFNQEPFRHSQRILPNLPTMGGPDLDQGKARSLGPLGADAPCHRAPCG